MRDNGGVIVNVIADMFRGMPMLAHTGAARAGVDNLTKVFSNLFLATSEHLPIASSK